LKLEARRLQLAVNAAWHKTWCSRGSRQRSAYAPSNQGSAPRLMSRLPREQVEHLGGAGQALLVARATTSATVSAICASQISELASPEVRDKTSKPAVYLPDLEQPRPPDMPPGMVKLRLVKG
jgi:hypothetical protein